MSRTDAPRDEGYWVLSQRPWTMLLFLTPLILTYEIGVRWQAQPGQGERHIVAFSLIESSFRSLGAGGRLVPAAALVSTLLAWHLIAGHRRTVRWGVFPGMLVESVLLAIPLLLIGSVMIRYLPLKAAAPESGWAEWVVASAGAGVYEEFLFRFIGFAALHFVLADCLKLPQRTAWTLVLLLTSVAFSAYHYLGPEPFDPRIFVYRTVAGLYLGGLMLTRGFAITAGCHTSYNILIELLRRTLGS